MTTVIDIKTQELSEALVAVFNEDRFAELDNEQVSNAIAAAVGVFLIQSVQELPPVMHTAAVLVGAKFVCGQVTKVAIKASGMVEE